MAHSPLSDGTTINDWLHTSSIDWSPCNLAITSSDSVDSLGLGLHYRYPSPDEKLSFQVPLRSLSGLPSSVLASPLYSPAPAVNRLQQFLIPFHTPLSVSSEDGIHSSVGSNFTIHSRSPVHPDDPHHCAFINQFKLTGTPAWISSSSYISPVIRAPPSESPPHASPPSDRELTPFGTKNVCFLDRIRSVNTSSPNSSPERSLAETMKSRLSSKTTPPALLSPCRLLTPPATKGKGTTLTPGPIPTSSASFETPTHPDNALMLSPLTPLSPGVLTMSGAQNSPDSPLLRNKQALKRTRRQGPLSSHPRPKRIRRTSQLSSGALNENEAPCDSPRSDQDSPFLNLPLVKPIYTNRPVVTSGEIEVSLEYPLFYRRFPAPSFYETSLSDANHPGGTYNHPRRPLDLYTPRFVKGKGAAKVGLCPICVEPAERGGESKKLWLAMKFSAFKCYHMQYSHGICASTGLPYSPPIAFRKMHRPNAGKKERKEIQEGKCHKCGRWVPVEGIKDMESKVKEIFWWKHAAVCHGSSSFEVEVDAYEQDEVYHRLASL